MRPGKPFLIHIDNTDRVLRLLPFDRDRLRREIKTTFRKVLDKEIELYALRKHWATWMSLKGVPGQIIEYFKVVLLPNNLKY